MRVARAVAAAGGSALVTGLVAGAAVAGPAAGAATDQAGSQAAPVIVMRPGVVHLTRALQGPPTTAYCEKNFKIACYTARQIQRAFNLNPLYATGIGIAEEAL